MNSIKTLATLALVLSQTAHAGNNIRQIGIATHFSGTDRNWFNPANWSTGRVPGANDAVVLDGTDDVVIDPALGASSRVGRVDVRDLVLRGSARLETLPGTRLAVQTEVIEDQAQVVHRSSAVEGELMIVAGPQACTNCGGLKLNPTPHSIRTVVLKSSVVQFGLGGRNASGISKVGPGTLILNGYGHYATMRAETLVLGDVPAAMATGIRARIDKLPSRATARIDRLPRLALALHYDFRPAVGDQFQIVTAGTLIGQFADLPEGALVGCTEDDSVGLWISYRGGDGNDVVLSARPGSPTCQTKEHILLARQVGVPAL